MMIEEEERKVRERDGEREIFGLCGLLLRVVVKPLRDWDFHFPLDSPFKRSLFRPQTAYTYFTCCFHYLMSWFFRYSLLPIHLCSTMPFRSIHYVSILHSNSPRKCWALIQRPLNGIVLRNGQFCFRWDAVCLRFPLEHHRLPSFITTACVLPTLCHLLVY